MCVFSYSLRLDGIAGNFLLRTDFTESHRVWIVVLSSLFLSRCFFNFLFDFLQWLIHWFFSCILLASSCLCFLVVGFFFYCFLAAVLLFPNNLFKEGAECDFSILQFSKSLFVAQYVIKNPGQCSMWVFEKNVSDAAFEWNTL